VLRSPAPRRPPPALGCRRAQRSTPTGDLRCRQRIPATVRLTIQIVHCAHTQPTQHKHPPPAPSASLLVNSVYVARGGLPCRLKASGVKLISAAQAKQLYDIYAAGGASAAGVTFVDFEAVMRWGVVTPAEAGIAQRATCPASW
jgi:hypothetical protein